MAGPDNVLPFSGCQFSTYQAGDFGKDARFIVFGQTGAGDRTLATAEIMRLTDAVGTICLPQALPSNSMYLVWACNNAGTGFPITVNRTEAWWLGPDKASRGDTVSVFGRNLGRYDSTYSGTNEAWIYLKPQGTTGEWAHVLAVNPYKVDFTVPATMSNGTCEVWVHNTRGGKYGWSGPLTLTIRNAVSWNGPVYSVKTYGAKGDGVTDDVVAINDALVYAATDAASTLYFPTGVYVISHNLIIPSNVRWRGDGKDFSFLKCATNWGGSYTNYMLFDNGSPKSTTAIEDLTLDTNKKCPYVLYQRDADSLWFTRVRFVGGTGLNDLNGSSHVFFKDCDLIGAQMFLGAASQVFMDGCNFYGTDDANSLIDTYNAEGVCMVNCTARDYDNSDTNSGAGWAQGRWLNVNGAWGSARDMYLGDNTSYDLCVRPGFANQGSGEQFLWEIPRLWYQGAPLAATTTTVTFADLTNDFSGATIVITKGRGVGQYRRLAGYNAPTRTITVSPAFNVPPDSTSLLVCGPYAEKMIVYHNTLDGKERSIFPPTPTASCGIEPYGSCLDFVVDNNVLHELRCGISLWAMCDENGTGMTPTYFNLFQNNRIQDCRSGISCMTTDWQFDIRTTGVKSLLGNVFRGNSVDDASGYAQEAISGIDADVNISGTADANIIEHNTSTNVAIGIGDSGSNAVNTIFYKNSMQLGSGNYVNSRGLVTPGSSPVVRENLYSGFETTYYGTLPGAVLEIPHRVMAVGGVPSGTVVTTTMCLWNAGSAAMSWTGSCDVSWLTLVPSNGVVTDENSSATIELNCNPSSLPMGTYTGTVTVIVGTAVMKAQVCLVVDEGADVDQDGMPDVWETKYFGSVTNSNGIVDSDHDGAPDPCEYIAGTVPTNSQSAFKMTIQRVANGNSEVSFLSLSATGLGYTGKVRRYTLESSTNLLLGNWPAVAGCSNLPGADALMTYTNISTGVCKFYRVRARLL
jgi:hypothetical protein